MPQAARRRDGEPRDLTRRAITGLAALAVALIPAAPARAAPQHACDLYRTLDRRCGCAGSDGYFRGYGEKYCERFMRSTGWSPAGLRWRARTLACLQGELRAFLGRAHACDCASVKAFAFESHARCYTRQPASVCRLPLSDIAHIYGLVDASDLLAPLGSGQTLAIALACVWQNGDPARPEVPAQ